VDHDHGRRAPRQARRDHRSPCTVRHRRAAADGAHRASEARPPSGAAPGGQEPDRLSSFFARGARTRSDDERSLRSTPMPATIYYDTDADLGLLEGRKGAILGYGSPGQAPSPNPKGPGGAGG